MYNNPKHWTIAVHLLLHAALQACSLLASATRLCSAGMGAQAEVAQMAMTYLRCRAVAAPVALAMFVATGSFRGFKDTK